MIAEAMNKNTAIDWIDFVNIPVFVLEIDKKIIIRKNSNFTHLLMINPNFEVQMLLESLNFKNIKTEFENIVPQKYTSSISEFGIPGHTIQTSAFQITFVILRHQSPNLVIIGITNISSVSDPPSTSFLTNLINQIEIHNRLFQLLAEGVWILDKEGTVIYANPALERMVNPTTISNVSIIGRSVEDFFADEDREKIKEVIKTHSTQRLELQLHPLSGRVNDVSYVLINHSPIFEENNKFAGFIGAVTDISDIKKLSNQIQERMQSLIQTEKMASLGLLISEVAHEVNNPISFILSNTETLKDYFETFLNYLKNLEDGLLTATVPKSSISSNFERDGQLKKLLYIRKKLNIEFIFKDLPKLLESNLKGLLRVQEVVSDLRMVSRTPEKVKYIPVNIHTSLDLVLNLLKHRMSNQIVIEKEYLVAHQVARVLAIPSKLDQVFVNILLNSIQAIEEKKPPKGLIRIVTTLEKEKIIKIEIYDDGIGISPDNKHKIFHPFFTTKEPTRGTGLGLSICLRIIQEFGGALGVFSDGENKGCKVVISLPVFKESEKTADVVFG